MANRLIQGNRIRIMNQKLAWKPTSATVCTTDNDETTSTASGDSSQLSSTPSASTACTAIFLRGLTATMGRDDVIRLIQSIGLMDFIDFLYVPSNVQATMAMLV